MAQKEDKNYFIFKILLEKNSESLFDQLKHHMDYPCAGLPDHVSKIGGSAVDKYCMECDVRKKQKGCRFLNTRQLFNDIEEEYSKRSGNMVEN